MAGIAIPFTIIGIDAVNAVLFGGLVFGALLALLAAVALQVRPTVAGRHRARNVLVVTYSLGAFAFLARGVSAMMSAEPLQAFTMPSGFQSAVFLAAATAAIVSTFGFMMLHKERADGEAVRMRHHRPAHRRVQPPHVPRHRRSASSRARAAPATRCRSSSWTSTTFVR
jgi:hypothetical protein